jgi:hypothetical protein
LIVLQVGAIAHWLRVIVSMALLVFLAAAFLLGATAVHAAGQEGRFFIDRGYIYSIYSVPKYKPNLAF